MNTETAIHSDPQRLWGWGEAVGATPDMSQPSPWRGEKVQVQEEGDGKMNE